MLKNNIVLRKSKVDIIVGFILSLLLLIITIILIFKNAILLSVLLILIFMMMIYSIRDRLKNVNETIVISPQGLKLFDREYIIPWHKIIEIKHTKGIGRNANVYLEIKTKRNLKKIQIDEFSYNIRELKKTIDSLCGRNVVEIEFEDKIFLIYYLFKQKTVK